MDTWSAPAAHTHAAEGYQLVIQEHLNHNYHQVTGQHKNYNKLKLRHPKLWITSMSNELRQLDLVLGDIIKSGTETIIFIHKHQIRAGRKATYTNAVCDYIQLKYDPYRVQITVGGDRLIYLCNPSAPDASLLGSKIIFNSNISTPGDQFFARI